jgi:hypothetical protein
MRYLSPEQPEFRYQVLLSPRQLELSCHVRYPLLYSWSSHASSVLSLEKLELSAHVSKERQKPRCHKCCHLHSNIWSIDTRMSPSPKQLLLRCHMYCFLLNNWSLGTYMSVRYTFFSHLWTPTSHRVYKALPWSLDCCELKSLSIQASST